MLAGVAFGSFGAVFDHQEPLAIWRHVVVAGGIRLDIFGVEHLASPAGATSLDSDVTLVVGPGNTAFGHCRLEFATGVGRIDFSHARALLSAASA